MKKIKVYTLPGCVYCEFVKDYFNEHNIEFECIDVSKNQNDAEMIVKKTEQVGVPVTIIDEDFVVGYDVKKIKELLK